VVALDVVEKPALRRDAVALRLLVLVLEPLVWVLPFEGAVALDCVPPPPPEPPLPDDPPAFVGEPVASEQDLSAT